MRTALAALLIAAALAVPARAAAPAPAADPAQPPKVLDEVVMVGATAIGQDGQRVLGRVREIDKKENKLWVIVNWGDNEGPVSVPLDRVRRIDYDVPGRRAELPAGDSLARYKLALWLLAVGLKDEALSDLEAVAGRPGVPADAWKLLARLQEAAGQLRQALESWKKYLAGQPEDAEAQAAVKRLEEKVKALPAEPQVQAPVPAPDPAKPAEPEKPKVTEGMEVRDGWRAQPWGNPADITLLKDDVTGNQYLAVEMTGDGKEGKTALSLRVNGDISKRSKLIFNIYNPDAKPLPLTVAFNTSSDFFETQFIWIKKGWNEGVAIDLNASDFKCRASDWSHKSPIKGKDQVNNIMILINEKRKATLYLDYIRFE
jgi:tetratricopeptide (TPR) repeat protein